MSLGKTLLPAVVAAVALATLQGCGGGEQGPGAQPPGRERTPGTAVLETGAAALQDVTPVSRIDVYLAGFHPMKEKPDLQVEAHHYCNQVNEDFAQCVLFDGNTERANLNGIEYIISERLFESLPDEEKPFWHPHNYEILSGQLVGPGLPDAAEKELMRRKMNSYGKTWHVWSTGTIDRQDDRLPLGEAMLAWSFNRDGELPLEVVERHHRQLGIDTTEKRQGRADLVPLANPQRGVDALADAFPDATGAPEGVRSR